MADRNINEILEEQRRSREEFLKLKKMQRGEIETELKQCEVAVVPKTFKEKAENFWFHYKWHTIGVVFMITVLTVLITQCVSRPKYDLEVVYFTYTSVFDQTLDSVEEYIEKFATDVNGDGDVNISVINCSVENDNTSVQYLNSVYSKVQALIAADEKAMLFITDKDSIKYFDNISDEIDFFADEPYVLSDDFYKATSTEEFGSLPKGLQISCREIRETMIEQNKDAKTIYESAKEILEKLKAADTK